MVPLAKIQASFVRQSPLQRWLGLASFEVLTAGSAFGRSVSVQDLGLDVARDLQESASARSEAAPEPVVTAKHAVETDQPQPI